MKEVKSLKDVDLSLTINGKKVQPSFAYISTMKTLDGWEPWTKGEVLLPFVESKSTSKK